MKLKCMIKGAQYDLVEGASFNDNYNETLDNGVIVIDQVQKMSLKPYDDVFIWDSSETFTGYINKGDYVAVNVATATSQRQVTPVTPTSAITGNDPATGLPIFSISANPQATEFFYGGDIISLWIDRYMNYTAETIGTFRYGLPNNITVSFGTVEAGVAHTRTMTLKSSTTYIQGGVFNAYFSDSSNKTVIVRLSEGGDSLISDNVLYQPDGFGGYAIAGTITSATISGAHSITVYNDRARQFGITFGNPVKISSFTDFQVKMKYMGIYRDVNASITSFSEGSFNVDVTFGNETIGLAFSRVGTTSNYACTYISGSDQEVGFFELIDDFRFLNVVAVAGEFSTLPSGFYKHMLVNSFSEERLSLGANYNSNVLYKYTINLFSETKKLEKVMLPNLSITQSLVVSEKRTCWYYIEQYIEMYSPKYKKISGISDKKWKYVQKYSASEYDNPNLQATDLTDPEHPYTYYKNGIVSNLKAIFDDIICPEMSFNNPSLKDVLSQIMIVKDIIPIVINDVVYGLDIGKIAYRTFNRNGMSFDVGNMSSASYATDARREYNGALSQENSAHMVEYLGFRTPGSAFLELASMVLETRFPIYKINTIKMCYYKKFKVGSDPTVKSFLCKYDITPLVLQNAVRNTLSTNYEAYGSLNGSDWVVDYSAFSTGSIAENLAKVAKYKLCTVGYDIGSNTISGWGATYTYLRYLWFKESKSYIENIIELLERISHVGTQIFEQQLKEGQPSSTVITIEPQGGGVDSIAPFAQITGVAGENISARLKSIVFEVDYDAMYTGAVMHDKDNIDVDDIVTADNCTSSLSVLELDGIHEKEKMNRMSNETYRFTARYDAVNCNGKANVNMGAVQELASKDTQYTQAIIYSREYQIFDNCILANYEAAEEYVMKNYFTSVWAKYRTYSLMSYGESVSRSENVRQFLYMSSDKWYYEDENLLLSNAESVHDLMSFLVPTDIDQYGAITNDGVLNCGYFHLAEGTITYPVDDPAAIPSQTPVTKPYGGYFLSDINTFASGDSLCMNIMMSDNISGGTYVKTLNESFNVDGISSTDKLIDYKASQDWHLMIASRTDAFTKNIGIYVCHLDNKAYFDDGNIKTPTDVYNLRTKILPLPKLDGSGVDYMSKSIGGDFTVNKDNKERINMTFQFSYIAPNEKDIVISPWVAKLNNMTGTYDKYDTSKQIIKSLGDPVSIRLNAFNQTISTPTSPSKKYIYLRLLEADYNAMNTAFDNSQSVSFVDASLANPMGYETQLTGPSGNVFFGGLNTWSFSTLSRTSYGHYRVRSQFIGENMKRVYEGGSIRFDNIPVSTTGYSGDIDLSVTSITEGGNVYYILYGEMPADAVGPWHLPFFEGGVDTTDDTRYCETTYTASMKLDINAANRITMPANMVILLANEKLTPASRFDAFQMADAATVSLPSGWQSDTNGINGVTNGHTIPQVFGLGDNVLTVNAGLYDSYPNEIKSIRYFYKDDQNWLHFVFGVNVEKESGSFQNRQIYLSCVSKRNMEVFGNNHMRIGQAANYLDDDITAQYGTGQYYKED